MELSPVLIFPFQNSKLTICEIKIRKVNRKTVIGHNKYIGV